MDVTDINVEGSASDKYYFLATKILNSNGLTRGHAFGNNMLMAPGSMPGSIAQYTSTIVGLGMERIYKLAVEQSVTEIYVSTDNADRNTIDYDQMFKYFKTELSSVNWYYGSGTMGGDTIDYDVPGIYTLSFTHTGRNDEYTSYIEVHVVGPGEIENLVTTTASGDVLALQAAGAADYTVWDVADAKLVINDAGTADALQSDVTEVVSDLGVSNVRYIYEHGGTRIHLTQQILNSYNGVANGGEYSDGVKPITYSGDLTVNNEVVDQTISEYVEGTDAPILTLDIKNTQIELNAAEPLYET